MINKSLNFFFAISKLIATMATVVIFTAAFTTPVIVNDGYNERPVQLLREDWIYGAQTKPKFDINCVLAGTTSFSDPMDTENSSSLFLLEFGDGEKLVVTTNGENLEQNVFLSDHPNEYPTQKETYKNCDSSIVQVLDYYGSPLLEIRILNKGGHIWVNFKLIEEKSMVTARGMVHKLERGINIAINTPWLIIFLNFVKFSILHYYNFGWLLAFSLLVLFVPSVILGIILRMNVPDQKEKSR